jgi:hypothetical protein
MREEQNKSGDELETLLLRLRKSASLSVQNGDMDEASLEIARIRSILRTFEKPKSNFNNQGRTQ